MRGDMHTCAKSSAKQWVTISSLPIDRTKVSLNVLKERSSSSKFKCWQIDNRIANILLLV